METLITILHLLVCLFLCLVVLLQSGRGGGMGAALGGASSQIFGGRGAGNFLSRVTSVAAIVFFLTSLTLTMLSSRHHSVVKKTKPVAAETTTEGAAKGEAEPAAPQAAPEAAPAANPAQPTNP